MLTKIEIDTVAESIAEAKAALQAGNGPLALLLIGVAETLLEEEDADVS